MSVVFIQCDELEVLKGMAGRIDSLMGAAVTIASTMGEYGSIQCLLFQEKQ